MVRRCANCSVVNNTVEGPCSVCGSNDLYPSFADAMKKAEESTSDMVNHPAHYTRGKIEVIDFIEDQKLGFKAGNVVKYVCRQEDKNGLEDLKKARWYLDRLIENGGVE